MATESWAGGTISGGADATAWSLKARGGLIPVAEVPNAPKTVAMPTVGNYPKVPNIRLDYPQKAPDMSSRAKKLMQEPLPSSFEEAGNIRTEAAGKGQMAVGKAISGLGEDITSVSSSIANVMGQLVAKEYDVRDAADKIKGDQALADYNERMQLAIDTKPPEEWKAIAQDEGKKLRAVTDHLGARRSTHDLIQAKVTAVTTTMEGTHLGTAALTKSLKDNAALGAELERSGTEEKDYSKRDKGIWLQDKAGAITHDQAKERYDRTGYLQGLDAIEVAKKTPEGAMRLRDQAEVVRKGGKSEEFKALNKNPSLAPNIEYDANQALKSHKANDLQDIKTRMDNGELNTDAKIDAATKGKFFSKESIETLKQGKPLPYVPYDSTAHANVRQALSKYDYNADTDGQNYEAIWNQIQRTVDKEHRGIYESVLNEKMKKGVAGKPDTRLETEAKILKANVQSTSKANMLPATAEERADLISGKAKLAILEKGEHPDTKKPLTAANLKEEKFMLSAKERAALDKNGATEIQLLDAIDDWTKKNPDAAPGKLEEEISIHPAMKNVEKNAGSVTDAAPRAQKVDVAERERRLAEARSTPTGMGAVPPRELNKPSPSFQKALGSGGQRSDVRATAYTKFEKGGDKVASRKGPLNTMELYQQGKVPYVSAAMDDNSQFQGKYVVYSAHPNVVFKVEDRGDAFVGKGNSAIDIAYDNRDMENAYETTGTIKEISAEEAAEISGAKTLTTAGGPTSAGPIQITSAVDPSYAAMSRPRNVSQISKIVVHGDVKTSVPDLISYAKQVDRGYHYYIATNGTITMAVPPDHIANHIKGANSDSIGIVIVGADNGKMPTPAQDAAAKLLISQLGKQYGIDPKNVAGHGERQPNRRDVREGGNVAKDIRENGFV